MNTENMKALDPNVMRVEVLESIKEQMRMLNSLTVYMENMKTVSTSQLADMIALESALGGILELFLHGKD